MQFNAKTICLSHNQVVPGSSPGGTTFYKPFKQLKGFFYVISFVNPRFLGSILKVVGKQKFVLKNRFVIFDVMKIAQKKIVCFIVFFFSIFSVIAEENPPSPTYRRGPPPPPNLSIDENIYIVIIIALLFGIYIIYNNRLKTKTSI